MSPKNFRSMLGAIALLWMHMSMGASFSVYPGDFTGDGKSDLLVIAKDPGALSGIYATDASGQPSTLLQSWNSGYLGISWHDSRYTAVVGNFDGVNGDDVLLQRNGTGTSFLLPTNSQGELYGISQYISGWGTDAYRIIAGKFDGNARADVFLQARQPSANSSVILSDSAGHLTVTSQSFANNHLGFKWSAANAIVHAGDFDGNGRDDLLVQAKPEIVLIDYDIPIPVPVFKPYSFGILLSTPAGQFTSAHQIFSRKDFGVDFSPNEVDIVVGKFNSDGRADLLLLARKSGQSSSVVLTDGNGQLTQASVVNLGAGTLGAELHTLAADFNGDGRSEVYRVASSGGANSIVSFTSSGSIAANVTHNPAPISSTLATAVGRTAGEASVSNTGAAEYSIPLWSAPGINGLQPSVALAYNSARENGVLGMGFEITGFSAITRCPKTLMQDSVATPVSAVASDGYCLDGQRLRLESGTYGVTGSVYRTEVERYARITATFSVGGGPAASGGPTSFEVYQRDGLIYEYGQTPGARIEYVGTTTVRAWALNAIRDRSNNRMEFSYVEDIVNGSYRPLSISYVLNAPAGVLVAPHAVQFVYENAGRPDPIYTYEAGYPAHELKRLARIEMQYQNAVVRQYLFNYTATVGASQRSRLASVQECSNSTAECFAATQLTWTNSVASLQAEQSSGTAIAGGGISTLHLIDVSGDSRDDLVYVSSTTSGGGTWRVRLSTGAGGLGSEIDTGILNTNYSQALSLEWDGDGKTDLLVPYANGRWYVLRANGSGFSAPLDTGIAVTVGGDQERAIDVNGDRLEDLVRLSSSGAAKVWVRYRNASGFDAAETLLWQSGSTNITFHLGFSTRPHYYKYRSRVRRADFEGDGREDFLAILNEFDPESGSSTRYYAAFSAGVFTGQLDSAVDLGGNHLWADLNADGNTDVLWVTTGKQIRTVLSTGIGGGGVQFGPTSSGFNASFAVVTDYDGDGRDDVLMPAGATGTAVNYFRSTGVGISAGVNSDLAWSGQVLRVAELDGNEAADVVQIGSDAILRYRHHTGAPSDLLDMVNDGYGIAVDFSYVRLAEAGAPYTPGSGAVYPVVEFPGPLTVVSSYTASDGTGGVFTKSFQYEQAREHALGRGFLGFAKRKSTDSRTGIRIEETYLQDPNEYQVIGAPSLVQVKQASGVLIAETLSTWSKHSFGSGASERRFPYASVQVSKRYELGGTNDGQLISTATTNNTVDAPSGLVTDSTTTVVEAGTANGLYAGQSHTFRTYHSAQFIDFPNWCFGRPTTTQQINSHTLPGGAQLTRTVGASWDGPRCRPTQTTIEPGNSQWQVTSDYVYDDFGNPEQMTLTPAVGQGQAPRVTKLNWGSTGQFPLSVTNPKSQTTTLAWNASFGVRSSVTDANNLTSSWQYDGFGRMTRQQLPDGTATEVSRYRCRVVGCAAPDVRSYVNLVARDTSNNVVRTDAQYFDGFDRPRFAVQRLLNGADSTLETRYDSLGRVSLESTPHVLGSDPAWYTTYVYDVLGRVKEVQRPTRESDLSTHLTKVSYQGLTTSVTDALDRTSKRKFSAVGAVLQSIDAAGSDTDYEYDAYGQLLKTIDVANNPIVLSYNVRGFKLTSNDPDLGAWSYTYFPLGELKSQTDAKNQPVSFTYDALSRPLTRTEPEGTTTWEWDTATKGIGQLAQVSSPGGYSEQYLYDSVGRRSQRSIVADAVTYRFDQTYNSLGLLDTLTYPTSTAGTRFKVRYGYAYGLQKSVRDYTGDVLGTMFWQANGTNASGQFIDEQLGNGIRTLSSYDRITGELSTRTAGVGGGTGVQHLAYAWDKVGNLTQRQDSRQSLTETFQYDPLDRLDSSKLNSVMNLDLAYDAIGNLTSKSDVGAYSYHPTKKHAVTSAGSNTYTYDANGNAITRNGFSINWTSYNLPSLINGAGGSSSAFSYGPERQRWKQQASYGGTAETTLYLGGLLEKVTLGSVTSWRHHIVGGEGEAAIYTRKSSGGNEVHYLSKDHIGSTDVITNAAGVVEVRTSFSAFGQRRNAAGWSGNPTPADSTGITATTRNGYTGHEMLDNLNLTHMNGRVYDQITGRFLSPDPFVQAPFDGQSLNRYSYVFNNPLSHTDPSGFYTLFSTHQNADGSGGFGSSFGDFLFATRSVHYGRPYYDFTDYSGRSRSGVLNAPPPNQAANQVASQAGPNATKAGVCNTQRCSAVGGALPLESLFQRNVQAGVNSLTLADFRDLIAFGYFERSAINVAPVGGGLVGIPTTPLKLRYYAGSDPVATAGQKAAGVVALYDVALAVATSRIGGSGGLVRAGAVAGRTAFGGADDVVFHYTNARAATFISRNGLFRDSSATNIGTYTASEALSILGAKNVEVVITIRNQGRFVPNRPPIVEPHPFGPGGGVDLVNPAPVPPDCILCVRPVNTP